MLKDLVKKNNWTVTVDLKDAYLSVPVHQPHRKFLHISWRGETLEFQCLPFGLSSAPRAFTKLLKPFMAILRRRGIRCIIYIDDLLLLSQSRPELIQIASEALSLLQLLGFAINWEKSHLIPSQSFPFLGFLLNSTTMSLVLPADKLQRIKQDCRQALHRLAMSVRSLARLIGKMTATAQAILPAPLYYRSLQHLKNRET